MKSILNNTIGCTSISFLSHDDDPPTIEDAETYSKDRIAPMIRPPPGGEVNRGPGLGEPCGTSSREGSCTS